MKEFLKEIADKVSGFTVRNEKFIFTTLARILAVCCILVAAYFAWKLSGQLKL